MKKHLLLLASAMLAFLFTSTKTLAQECLYLDYCGDQIASSGQSRTGSKKNIEAAIYLPAEMLQSYIGCQISGVMVGTPDIALPDTMTYTSWLRVDKTKNDKLAHSEKATAQKAGWQRLDFTEPYTITGKEEGIFVGYRFYQTSAIKCLSFVSPANTNAAWLGYETKLTGGGTAMSWANVSSTIGGSLSIRAIVTGDIPHNNISLQDVKAKRAYVQMGDDIVITGTVKNNANGVAKLPKIRYSLNGTELGQYPVVTAQNLEYLQTADFTISIPSTSITEESTAKVDLELIWSDGTVDDAPADNVATVNVEMLKEVFARKMVCEEGTGTWCGWCVRGYVGLKKMKAQHGDDFIGIGVHNSDEFEYDPYDSWMGKQITGYPSALVNRDGTVYDPNFAELEGALEKMDKLACAKVEVNALLEGNILNMAAKVQFAANIDHEVRVAFVVLEDNVSCSQHNYYSGGSYGSMDGFENLSNPTTIPMHDAARYISNPKGDENSLSAAPRKGRVYEYGTTVDLTTLSNKVVDKSNLSVVALLIDQNTGEILNGEITENMNSTGVDIIRENSQQARGIYDLSGRRVNNAQKGIYIINGKKIIK